MKAIAILLLALAFTFPVHADENLVVNGDFVDGHAHWKGDAKDPDTAAGASIDFSNPTASQGGVVITLRKDKWTKMYQLFSTRAKKLHYSITFTLSPDYKPDRAPLLSNGASPGLDDIENVYPYAGYSGGSWMLILAQTGLSSTSLNLNPDVSKKGPQTLTGILGGAPDEYDEMTVVFGFPPGTGTISITKISLTGGDK